MGDERARDVAQALDLLPVDIERVLLRRAAHQLPVLLCRAALDGRGRQQQQTAPLNFYAFFFLLL